MKQLLIYLIVGIIFHGEGKTQDQIKWESKPKHRVVVHSETPGVKQRVRQGFLYELTDSTIVLAKKRLNGIWQQKITMYIDYIDRIVLRSPGHIFISNIGLFGASLSSPFILENADLSLGWNLFIGIVVAPIIGGIVIELGYMIFSKDYKIAKNYNIDRNRENYLVIKPILEKNKIETYYK